MGDVMEEPKYDNLFTRIYDAAERDLDDKESDDDADLLEEYPLIWCRALRLIEEHQFGKITRVRASIDHLKPASGEVQSREWLRARAIVASQEREIQERIGACKLRREEARAMLGVSSGAEVFTTGALMDLIDSAIQSIVAEDGDSAVRILRAMIKRLDKHEIDKENTEDDKS